MDIIRKKSSASGESSPNIKSNLGILKLMSQCHTLPHKAKTNKTEAPSPRTSKSEESLVENENIFSGYTTTKLREQAKQTDDLTTALQLKLVLNNLHSPVDAKTPFSSGETLDDFDGAASSERLECCVDDYEGEMMPPLPSPTPGVMTDAQGLIIPKKLTNPCLIDPERQSLHRELMFNQKIGRSVLNQKTELQKALEKQKERQFAQQLQQQHQKATENTIGGELAHVIMQRAQRLENTQKPPPQDDIEHVNPEYLSARARLRHTAH